ncbi:SMI1/KNR4 family protein [Streptomyces sp. TRM70308]|uniref:SMI1/KNR4 family protein n=1 Tax=Streptomyces sp. TRM70308 TaxID=3131932 RepID=UPI003CFFF8D9
MVEDMQRLQAAWGRVEAWLREYAPASAALLRPPASEEQISATEDEIGVRLPPVLRAWYQIHDGALGSSPEDEIEEWAVTGWLPMHRTWLRLEEVTGFYLTQVQEWEREPGLIPIACNPGDGWYGLYLDAREDEPTYGNLGTWAVDQESEPMPDGTDGWPLADWLEATASALEERRCLRRPDGTEDIHEMPVLNRGGLDWVHAQTGFKEGMRSLTDL